MIFSVKDPEYFTKILSLLLQQAVGILPCDTIYGLVGIAPETREKLQAIKGREENKPFLMLTHSAEIIGQYSPLPVPEVLKRFWPGPLTIIFPLYDASGKAAFRIPNDPFLLNLLEKLGKPLYSTSVNVSGKEFLWKIDEIIDSFEPLTDFIVNAGDLSYAVPSTIIDISTTPFTLVREGALSVRDIPAELKKHE